MSRNFVINKVSEKVTNHIIGNSQCNFAIDSVILDDKKFIKGDMVQSQ